MLSDGTLMIEEARSADQGNYGCMATNDAGEAVSGPATLILQPEPSSIIGVFSPKCLTSATCNSAISDNNFSFFPVWIWEILIF